MSAKEAVFFLMIVFQTAGCRAEVSLHCMLELKGGWGGGGAHLQTRIGGNGRGPKRSNLMFKLLTDNSQFSAFVDTPPETHFEQLEKKQ